MKQNVKFVTHMYLSSARCACSVTERHVYALLLARKSIFAPLVLSRRGMTSPPPDRTPRSCWVFDQRRRSCCVELMSSWKILPDLSELTCGALIYYVYLRPRMQAAMGDVYCRMLVFECVT